MSSFLCFVCHSTVNADTNEETREKYREVIGMNLCPDSHLCFICCHFLNKMCLFKSICLKRSLEYPVLFSEKGTINLQRGDIQVAILCPEDICLQHLNTRYHFYNNSENSQSDFDENSYCQLQDDRTFEVNTLLKSENVEDFQNNDYTYSKDDIKDNLFNNELIGPNLEPVRVTKNDADEKWHVDGAKAKHDAVLLELDSKIEVAIEDLLPNTEYDTDKRQENIDTPDTDREGSPLSEETLNIDTSIEQEDKMTKKKKRSEKDFEKIKLTVKEQKKELEEARREEKYIEAGFKCYNCAMTFNFKDSYQAHMMRHEESNGEYSCPICSLRFANPAVLRSHTANHSERYRCSHCGGVVRPRQRGTHLRGCTGCEGVGVTCHLCGSVFRGVSHFQQHMKRFHQSKNSNRTYLCNVCGKSYNNQAAVRTHMITHINRKFSCDQCTSTFSSPYTLNQHKKKHNSPDQQLHYCTTCKIGYDSRKSLLAHRRNALAHKDSVYKCPVCPRICPSLKALQWHTASLHTRTNHLACGMCPAKYSTRKALVRHMRRHSVEGPKATPLCHACGENFKSISILKRHLKNVCEKDKLEELPYYE